MMQDKWQIGNGKGNKNLVGWITRHWIMWKILSEWGKSRREQVKVLSKLDGSVPERRWSIGLLQVKFSGGENPRKRWRSGQVFGMCALRY